MQAMVLTPIYLFIDLIQLLCNNLVQLLQHILTDAEKSYHSVFQPEFQQTYLEILDSLFHTFLKRNNCLLY